jgi:hypothetical protein
LWHLEQGYVSEEKTAGGTTEKKFSLECDAFAPQSRTTQQRIGSTRDTLKFLPPSVHGRKLALSLTSKNLFPYGASRKYGPVFQFLQEYFILGNPFVLMAKNTTLVPICHFLLPLPIIYQALVSCRLSGG